MASRPSLARGPTFVGYPSRDARLGAAEVVAGDGPHRPKVGREVLERGGDEDRGPSGLNPGGRGSRELGRQGESFDDVVE